MLADSTIRGLTVAFEPSASALSAPRVTHAATGQVLVDYWGTGWFGTASIDHRGRLRLWIRREKKDVAGHVVVIDTARGTITRDYGRGRLAVQRPDCLMADRLARAGDTAGVAEVEVAA